MRHVFPILLLACAVPDEEGLEGAILGFAVLGDDRQATLAIEEGEADYDLVLTQRASETDEQTWTWAWPCHGGGADCGAPSEGSWQLSLGTNGLFITGMHGSPVEPPAMLAPPRSEKGFELSTGSGLGRSSWRFIGRASCPALFMWPDDDGPTCDLVEIVGAQDPSYAGIWWVNPDFGVVSVQNGETDDRIFSLSSFTTP